MIFNSIDTLPISLNVTCLKLEYFFAMASFEKNKRVLKNEKCDFFTLQTITCCNQKEQTNDGTH